ncbi:MAG TPA: YkgJ family cysteine cluster protein [Kofleriaceae bacterium]
MTEAATPRRALVVLQEVDQMLAETRCDATAECCHFAVTGKQPFLTEAEWQLVMDELVRQGRTVPPPREDKVCGFLGDDRRCTIYEARPLGCRTFFCHRVKGPRVPRRAYNDFLRRLEVMSSDPEANGRSITSWLNQARRANR